MSREIEILTEVEAIRKNPGMFIGSTDSEGAHHLLYETIHNSLDEAMAGHCNHIDVILSGSSCQVSDDGRGIPVEKHPAAGVSSVEVALTRLHAGSKFKKSKGDFTSGLHGVGLSCVNALSSSLMVNVNQHGKNYVQEYHQGKPLAPLRETGQSPVSPKLSGTSIQFTPDPRIFKEFEKFDWDVCATFIEKLAHLKPGLTLTLKSESIGREERFQAKEPALVGLLKKNTRNKRELLPDPIRVLGSAEESGEFSFEGVFTWTAEIEPRLMSFVNCVETIHGGTHLNAFRSGIIRAVNRMLSEVEKSAWNGDPAEIDEVSEGLSCVLSCKVLHPLFDGQTKTRFTNLEVIEDIERETEGQTYQFFSKNPQVASLVFRRISEARNARLAVKRIGERIYFQNVRQGIDEEVYKEQFGARSKNWHESAVWITHDELLKSHASLCEAEPESIALDVCCGSGVVGASFRGRVKKVIGLDLTPEMVGLAKQRLDEVHQGNVYNLPFPDNSFDLVCTREVLHLLPFPERPVSEIFRVLKPGGQFIVGQILPFSEDDAAWMYRIFKKKQPLIHNMFQEEDFRRLLHSPGFTEMKMTEMTVWESIDVWIDSYETTPIHQHEIRALFREAPAEAKAVHPFKISANGEIQDLWRWCIFSVKKPKK